MSKRQLYRDILDEGSAAGFEDTVLRKTVAAARRTRRLRIASRCTVLIVLAAMALFQFRPRRQVEIARAPLSTPQQPSSHTILRTEPFASRIRTHPLPASQSLPTSANVVVLRTSEAASANLRFIDDDQLLAFFEGKPVALIHHGARNAELVFPEDNTTERR